MNKEDIPQDPGALSRLTKEVCYAVDESGKYVTALSNGWEVKASALDITWKDIDEHIAAARQKVLQNELSPVAFFIEYRLMDMATVSAYTGFWQWQIKRHKKPGVFKKLSEKELLKYATAFDVTLQQFKTLEVNED